FGPHRSPRDVDVVAWSASTPGLDAGVPRYSALVHAFNVKLPFHGASGDSVGLRLQSNGQSRRCRPPDLPYCDGAPIDTGRTGDPAAPCARNGRIMVHETQTLSLASSPRRAFCIW